jgi:branched-subunit amino acid ABC-type transport system permease component
MLAPPYVVVALAYGILYGLLGQMDLTVAARFTFAAYGGAMAQDILGWNPAWDPAVWAAGVAFALALAAVCFLLFEPLARQPPLAVLVGSLGIGHALQALFQGAFGATPRSFDHYPVEAGIDLLGTTATPLQLAAVVYVAAVCAFMAWFLRRSGWARRLAAVAANADLAATVFGVSRRRIALQASLLTAGLVAPAAVLHAASHGVSPTTGIDIGLLAFVAAIIVGTGRPLGAAAAALGLVVLRSLAVRWPLWELLALASATAAIAALRRAPRSTERRATAGAALAIAGAALASRLVALRGSAVVVPGSLQDVVPYAAVVVALLLRPRGLFDGRLPRAV